VLTLRFVSGTLELVGELADEVRPAEYVWDARTECYRAPARCYAGLVMALRGAGIEYEDEARAYPNLEVGSLVHREPRPLQ